MQYCQPGVSPGPPSHPFPLQTQGQPPVWLNPPKAKQILAAASVPTSKWASLLLPSPFSSIYFLYPVMKKSNSPNQWQWPGTPTLHPNEPGLHLLCPTTNAPLFPCGQSRFPASLPPELSFPSCPSVWAAESKFQSLGQLYWARGQTSEGLSMAHPQEQHRGGQWKETF